MKEIESMKKMVNWLKRNRQKIAVGIVSAIFSALVSWGLAWLLISPPVEVSNLPQKELTCTLIYVGTLLLPARERSTYGKTINKKKRQRQDRSP